MSSVALRLAVLLLPAALVFGACASRVPRPTKAIAARRSRLPPVSATVASETMAASYIAAVEAPDDNAEKRSPLVTPERLEQGLTIFVVGVNGDNSLSAGLAPGLAAGGYAGAIEVLDWTTGHWPLFVYHLRAEERHRAGAELIAHKIAAYRSRYPGRDVNLVGYSAGAVVAIEAIESLAEQDEVDRVVLVAGAISPAHDLSTALRHTRVGIWSYYQPQDVVALWAGTLLVGTADGHHLMSAGAVGFWQPLGASESERDLYRDKLVQLPYQPQMALSGNLGGHFQCVGQKFVAEWIAPVLDAPASRMAFTLDKPRAAVDRSALRR